MARGHHTREEVIEAIGKIKLKHPTASLAKRERERAYMAEMLQYRESEYGENH